MNTPSNKHEHRIDAGCIVYNIPQARVSPTVSKTRLHSFPCQSEVFVHCPLSSWLIQVTLGYGENNLNIWFETFVEILKFHDSVCYFSPMNHWVALEWLHEVWCWDKPKQENSRWQTKTKLIKSTEDKSDQSSMPQNAGKMVEECCKVPPPRQASTKLTEVWYLICLFRRMRQKGNCCNRGFSCIEGFSSVVSLPLLVCCSCTIWKTEDFSKKAYKL